MFQQNFPSLNPVQFFAVSADCHPLAKGGLYPSMKSHFLPGTSDLTGEECFAKIAIGWSDEGIGVRLVTHQPAVRSFYPEFDQGDSVEFFFDTRDLKSAGFNTRFCHQFLFLPQSVEGVNKCEMTHFRTDDRHPLCDSQDLQCNSELKKKEYSLSIFIPSHCLHGYDPKQFNRLGFTYRIHRFGGLPQHFSVVSQDYQIDQHPSLWGSLFLK